MWFGACLGEATASDSFLDVSAGRIIGGEIVGGEIVFERFRFVAEIAAWGIGKIPRLSGFQKDKG